MRQSRKWSIIILFSSFLSYLFVHHFPICNVQNSTFIDKMTIIKSSIWVLNLNYFIHLMHHKLPKQYFNNVNICKSNCPNYCTFVNKILIVIGIQAVQSWLLQSCVTLSRCSTTKFEYLRKNQGKKNRKQSEAQNHKHTHNRPN